LQEAAQKYGGHKLKRTHAYEILAKLEGLRNRHVLLKTNDSRDKGQIIVPFSCYLDSGCVNGRVSVTEKQIILKFEESPHLKEVIENNGMLSVVHAIFNFNERERHSLLPENNFKLRTDPVENAIAKHLKNSWVEFYFDEEKDTLFVLNKKSNPIAEIDWSDSEIKIDIYDLNDFVKKWNETEGYNLKENNVQLGIYLFLENNFIYQ
jgi:hypothetical protein